MLILGTDTETTGLNKDQDVIVELGAVLFKVEGGVWEPVSQFNHLVCDPDYPKMTPEITAINGITDSMLQEEGIPFAQAMKSFMNFMAEADMVIAHNSGFDRDMIVNQSRRKGFGASADKIEQKQWLCSAEDLESNYTMKCWKLSHLALDYGVAVDPSVLHRASADIKLMGQMLSAIKASPEEMLAFRNTPWQRVSANIPAPWKDGGKGVAEAKSRKYAWDSELKLWCKRIKANKTEEEVKQAPFPVDVLN